MLPLPLTRLPALLDAPLFQGLTPHDLAPLLETAWLDTVMPGATVVAEGERNDALYLVLAGRLKVVLPAAGRRRLSSIYLNTVGPLDTVGEYALFDNQPASASVIALAPTRLVQIAKADLETWLAADPRRAATVYRNVLRALIERRRRKDRELDLEAAPVRP